MSFKIDFNGEIHKLARAPTDFKSVLSTLRQIGGDCDPKTFKIQYLDSEGDKIMLTSEDDYKAMLSAGGQLKIFVSASESKSIKSSSSSNKLDDVIPVLSESHVFIKKDEPVVQKPKEEPKVETPAPKEETPGNNNNIYANPDAYSQFRQSVLYKSYKSNYDYDVRDTITDVVYSNIPEIAMLVKDFISESTKSEKAPTESKMLKSQVNTSVHQGIICDGCGCQPIVGNRYKCSVCADYDLCEACEENTTHEHTFLKIKKPVKLVEVPKVQVPKISFKFLEDSKTIPEKISVSDLVVYKTLKLKNDGEVEWPKNCYLVCLGDVRGEKNRLTNISAGKELTTIITIHNPRKAGKVTSSWCLAYMNEKNVETLIGEPFEVSYEVPEPKKVEIEIKEEKLEHSPEVYKKAKQLKEIFPDIDVKKFIEVINKHPDMAVDEIALNFLTV